jgi:tRNA nucleotidyltransferase (CCA-adding enzyme)
MVTRSEPGDVAAAKKMTHRKPNPRQSASGPRLPAALARRLALARSVARRAEVRLFLVGGAVRDLFLGLPVRDLDLAVEGDAAALARSVGEALGAPARVHGRFGTATVELPGGERLDFAATRREVYERPGALPRVSPASIDEDLFRRDFTANAMALDLSTSRARLHDPFGGRHDLARRRLRVLHALSFQDDPTRGYRAARYANRLRFAVDPDTRRAALEAVRRGDFDAISGDRRRRELRLLFSESRRAGAVQWMAKLDLPATLHAALSADAATLARLRRAERLGERPSRRATGWLLYLLVWAAGLQEREAGELADRLSLAGEERRLLRSWPETLARLYRPLPRERLSAIADLRLSPDEIAAAAVCSPRPQIRALLREVLERAPIGLAIRGRDLLRAGVAPGPEVGRALAKTLAARRDGMISRERELEFALDIARRRPS